MTFEEHRPDPDTLLRLAERQEQPRAGRLKLFFGACAGVGKTYAMLNNARQLQQQRVDVVVGLVETHGRAETAALLEGLELLPRRTIEHRGKALEEFDLDAALARRPSVLLVDELAHNNVPGCRHPKRWQDVEELLAAGIDVFSTLNVQHLESLNDVVGGITGINIRETVPDRLFQAAHEVVLVDLTPDDLLQRLREGKVYIPQQAERALRNFFRKGNLVALRELALRCTADRVDDDIHLYRREQGGGEIWHTRERLLACIGPAPGSETVLRSAGRMAAALNAEWHALFIETPAIAAMDDAARGVVMERLKLAESMGAITATLIDASVAAALARYAQQHNITKVVLGRSVRYRWWQRRDKDLPRAVAARLPAVDIVIMGETRPAKPPPPTVRPRPVASSLARRYFPAAAVSILTSLAVYPAFPPISQTNIAMLYLATLIPVAMRFGRGPATLAAALNVLAFDVLFVNPRFTLAVADVQYLLTFAVMLAVGLVIGRLTARLKFQANVATQRQERAQELYELARKLSAALTPDQIAQLVQHAMVAHASVGVSLLLPDIHNKLEPPSGEPLEDLDLSVAQWAFENARPAGANSDTLPGSRLHYMPLKAPMRVRGVMAVALPEPRLLQASDLRQQLDTIAALAAIALERIHFVHVAQETLLQIESQRLRESLLSALSHDLRTPITSIAGIAEALAGDAARMDPRHEELVEALRTQTQGMSRLVANLLDMARLQSGKRPLRADWQSLEEIVGTARQALSVLLRNRELIVDIPEDFPLLHADGVLLERVFVNLIENAVKYVPPPGRIGLTARTSGLNATIEVWDEGSGLPGPDFEKLFTKFCRGVPESTVPGVGLGLAICRAIVEAHGGTISARNRREAGASFLIHLPLKEMPALEPLPILEDTEQ